MKTQKLIIGTAFLWGSLLLGACGTGGPVGIGGWEKAWGREAETPEAAARYTMESLKELDLKAFNDCTDNYVETYRNWFGIPVEREYRVFNELLQPSLKVGKHYRFNLQMAEKTVEKLEWEITDIREDGTLAEIDMEITNRDMAEVMGNYEILLLENMIEAEGSGIWRMVSDMADLSNGGGALLSLVDEQEDTCAIAVTVLAYWEDGCWKLHLSDEFINAFMGNMNLGEYSEETKRRLDELEEKYAEKVEDWAEEFMEDMEMDMGKIKIW